MTRPDNCFYFSKCQQGESTGKMLIPRPQNLCCSTGGKKKRLLLLTAILYGVFIIMAHTNHYIWQVGWTEFSKSVTGNTRSLLLYISVGLGMFEVHWQSPMGDHTGNGYSKLVDGKLLSSLQNRNCYRMTGSLKVIYPNHWCSRMVSMDCIIAVVTGRSTVDVEVC